MYFSLLLQRVLKTIYKPAASISRPENPQMETEQKKEIYWNREQFLKVRATSSYHPFPSVFFLWEHWPTKMCGFTPIRNEDNVLQKPIWSSQMCLCRASGGVTSRNLNSTPKIKWTQVRQSPLHPPHLLKSPLAALSFCLFCPSWETPKIR